MIAKDGYEIRRGIVGGEWLTSLRKSADALSRRAGTACVRRACCRSVELAAFSQSSSLTDLLPGGYLPVRSLLFDKTPEQNWPVPWHQDLTVAVCERVEVAGYGPWTIKDGVPHVQPPVDLLEQMITVRVHLDDAGQNGGALRVVPGSHRVGIISTDDLAEFKRKDSVTCECEAGDALLMSPLLLHSSLRTKHQVHRRVLHFEFAPPDALHPRLKWFEVEAQH